MNRLLFLLREEAEQESRENSILDTQKYLNRQWDGIIAKRKYRSLLVGCSAEGQVSHILSARLSSRPMGWSVLGANQMASLRVHRENGVNVASLHIKQSAKKNIVSKQFVEQTNTYMAKAAGSIYETFGNMPSLESGNRGWSALLRRIANEGLSI